MKTIIAGSRSIVDYKLIRTVIEQSKFDITIVICGGARGVDKLGAKWAINNNIPIKYFYANWNKYGKSAGAIRNEQMAKEGEALIAIWDGVSFGTKNMIKLAFAYDLKLYIHDLSKKEDSFF